MKRLTSNKPVSDMSMMELAHNSCYADDNRKARYRDYELDIDSRELVKNLVKDMCNEDLTDMSDGEFDEYMGEMLSVEMDSQIGLIALVYRNLWVMANLRERLKYYEDLEEQGRLLELPCKVGDNIYRIEVNTDACYECEYFKRSPDRYSGPDDYCISPEVTTRDGKKNPSCPTLNYSYPLCEKHFYEIVGSRMDDIDNIYRIMKEVGKTVFLTRESAGEKLKEMEETINGKQEDTFGNYGTSAQ